VFRETEINAPHGFMIYYRSDLTAVMAGSQSFWKATQYLTGNHTIAERMFRHDPSVMLHAPLRTLLYADLSPRLPRAVVTAASARDGCRVLVWRGPGAGVPGGGRRRRAGSSR
jgi:hypothetical protein